jgi:hypothetical protein
MLQLRIIKLIQLIYCLNMQYRLIIGIKMEILRYIMQLNWGIRILLTRY